MKASPPSKPASLFIISRGLSSLQFSFLDVDPLLTMDIQEEQAIAATQATAIGGLSVAERFGVATLDEDWEKEASEKEQEEEEVGLHSMHGHHGCPPITINNNLCDETTGDPLFDDHNHNLMPRTAGDGDNSDYGDAFDGDVGDGCCPNLPSTPTPNQKLTKIPT